MLNTSQTKTAGKSKTHENALQRHSVVQAEKAPTGPRRKEHKGEVIEQIGETKQRETDGQKLCLHMSFFKVEKRHQCTHHYTAQLEVIHKGGKYTLDFC